MPSNNSSINAFCSAAKWITHSVRGKGANYYRHDPQGYEDVARVLMGRNEVAESIRQLLDSDGLRPQRKLAVDAACGTGLITHALRDCADRVVGHDICNEAISYAQQSKHPSLEFIPGDLHDFSRYEQGSVDVYTMAFAHRYIQDRQKFYRDLAAVLSANGRAIITTAGTKSMYDAIQDHSNKAGLSVEMKPSNCSSLFNRLHRTSHFVLKHLNS